MLLAFFLFVEQIFKLKRKVMYCNIVEGVNAKKHIGLLWIADIYINEICFISYICLENVMSYLNICLNIVWKKYLSFM